MKTAIAFLCNTPHPQTLEFAMSLGENTDFHVYVISDCMDFVRQSKYYTVVQIHDNICVDKGYCNSNISDNATHIKKNPIAYDKFLAYFCDVNTSYDFVWAFEDDVFIPSIQTLINLHTKYQAYDLVTPNNNYKGDETPDWHWPHIFDKVKQPYHYSMVCAAGVSRLMLAVIRNYVRKNKTLFYIEAMFNTLAMHNNLNVVDAKELKSIVWMGEWNIDHFTMLPDNLFHPLKNKYEHFVYRKQINKAILNNYKPNIKLPSFLL